MLATAERFNVPTSSSLSRMMKLADSSLTDHIQLLNKPLEGRESFFGGAGEFSIYLILLQLYLIRLHIQNINLL